MKKQQSISLVRSAVIAVIVAALALVIVILPAEYNIDPTGLGEKLGLTVFNTDSETVQSSTPKVSSDGEQDVVVLTVPAGKGIEYKLDMRQYAKANYQWQTAEGELYHDLHGEPKGDTTGYFESYAIATVNQMKGSFTAPFAGSHGWYWKNSSDKDIQVQLIFSGDYVIEGLKQ